MSYRLPTHITPSDESLFRTMKNAVKDELTIPKQTRYLVPVELGRVERLVRFLEMSYRHLQLTIA